jgi:diadenosine tetraphosphatase ApaH/serine/threonine PP2A family protein phosphatase
LERLSSLPRAQFVQGNTDRYLVTGRRPPQPLVEEESQWRSLPAFLQEREANFSWTVGQLEHRWCSFLKELPLEQRLEVPGYGSIVGVHASPSGDEVGIWADTPEANLREMLSDAELTLLLCGHTHCPLDRPVDKRRVVNVGSVGLPLDGDRRAAYGIVDLEGGDCQVSLHRVEYDVDGVIDKLTERGHPALDWVGTRLRLARTPG